ncbi:MAG: UPF0280 family protein [Archaeoglobaceae archaeon]|nr:UPF0280 family protein [Archaeoglobaceae archaeon]MDW8118732.1 UPF0280 family protein [Archaeoglobaceae archaeon]
MKRFKRFKFSYGETNTTILTESDEFYKIAIKAILEARSEIEEHIKLKPEFLISYEPLNCKKCSGKRVTKEMCHSARIAKVGPMASVAGAIAQFAVDKMVEAGANVAVVDNGGDIAIHSDEELKVAIYPSKIALLIPPTDKIAICTSSGKIGHSVSFGWADSATIIAENACIADAFATALGNAVKDFGKDEIKITLSNFYSENREFIKGAIVIKDDIIAFAGNIPEISTAEYGEDLITKP